MLGVAPLHSNPAYPVKVKIYRELVLVDLSLVQSQIILQGGLSHRRKFRLRYAVNGDPGAWVETA